MVIVVVTYSFSPDSRAIIFPNEEEAKKFIWRDYHEELARDEEAGYTIESDSYCCYGSAQLVSTMATTGITSWSIADIEDKTNEYMVSLDDIRSVNQKLLSALDELNGLLDVKKDK